MQFTSSQDSTRAKATRPPWLKQSWKYWLHMREEAGCLGIHGFRSTHDPRLFYIHSRWSSEQAFDTHATLPTHVVLLKSCED